MLNTDAVLFIDQRSSIIQHLIPLTVVILTHNEECNIGDCVRSVAWAEDVIVVDSGSTDGTLAEAILARPDVRTFHHPFQDFGDQRNWALDQTAPRQEWVLFLDADERVTPELAKSIANALSNRSAVVGYFLCYKNYFLGRWLKRCTRFPTWQLRLLKRGDVRYEKMGHGQREVTTGPLDYIHAPYHHYGFSQGVAHWIARHNIYSSAEIGLIDQLRQEPLAFSDLWKADRVGRTRCMKRIAARLPFRPIVGFCYLYLWRRGFLDGYAGLMFCLLRLTHEIHIVVKQAEKKAVSSQPSALIPTPPVAHTPPPPSGSRPSPHASRTTQMDAVPRSQSERQTSLPLPSDALWATESG